MTHKFTCMTCRVAFDDADIQRQHYKTDWHRYNLKRKVAELPHVSAEEFQKKVIEQRAKKEADAKDTALFCKVCRKVFSSAKAFDNHLNSKKHKSALTVHESQIDTGESLTVEDISEPINNVSKDATQEPELISDHSDEEYDSEIEELDSDEWDDGEDEISENNPIIHHNCLFCVHHSATMTKNLKHMSTEHSFFIPDLDYLVDLRGLLLYLGEKVCKFNMCLWCDSSGRSFHSMDSAQRHMRDKGHCKMLHEGAALAQYSSYYNYAKSYPDNDESMDIDEEIIPPVLDGSDYELVLPSGAKIGHRDLVVYYRQNLNTSRDVAVKKNKLKNLMATYRALGWNGVDKEAAARNARDMQYISKVQTKYFTKLGVKANKLQKHFRPQVNF